ncbi:MAG: DUF58 domain-containing protein [Acidimicrobiales bacterium]
MRRARPTLTRRGWAVAIGSGVLGVTARILGTFELFVLATGGGALVAGATLLVGTRFPRLQATRRLSSTRAHAGEVTRVELRVTNAGRSRSWPVWMDDRLGSSHRASLLLPALAPGAGEQAFYRLPPLERGLHSIGPLEARVVDPFGLAERVTTIAAPTDLLVYPRVQALRPLTAGVGEDTRAGSPSALLSVTGDDFASLRAYEAGDDLRRVHWPSTARRDELMVRQHESPRQGRVIVVLDARHEVHSDSTFEPAVSAAASILRSCREHGQVVRLLTTAGDDSGFGTASGHLDAAMARLALIQPGDGRPLHQLAALYGSHAAVVTVTADTAAAGHGGATAGRRSRSTTVVVFEDAFGTAVAGPGVIRVPSPEMFGPAWDRAMSRAKAGAAT